MNMCNKGKLKVHNTLTVNTAGIKNSQMNSLSSALFYFKMDQIKESAKQKQFAATSTHLVAQYSNMSLYVINDYQK